ncbi:trehalose-phosphatase [Streptomyces xiaopingdaonensis]|uniref:trehalose-phosphatase n=1 Tax=Streptomyces xiaopingdaonensis TaxID=1565415 RepID=UPI0002E7156A|nr:trehalose-phosphatase [Streptomyces xiaopingdaonensis]
MASHPLAVPATSAGREGLDAFLAHPERAVVALDFDGTLAPIVSDPARAYAHPEALPVLSRLAPALLAVVIVTGRPAAEAVRLGGFRDDPPPNLTVLGAYGAERWEGRTGDLEIPEPPPGVAAVRAELPVLLAELGAPSGTAIEDKGGALAVHTRNTERPQETFDALTAPLQQLATRHQLVTEPGRQVIELRPPGVHKGTALTAFVEERGASALLYAGDDLGDLEAFAAVERLRDAGVPGVKVCSGSDGTGDTVPALAERADVQTTGGPAGVLALLGALGERLASS